MRIALEEILTWKSSGNEIPQYRILIDTLDGCDQLANFLKSINQLVKKSIAAGTDVRVCISRRCKPSFEASELETLAIVVEDNNGESVLQFIQKEVQKIAHRILRFQGIFTATSPYRLRKAETST